MRETERRTRRDVQFEGLTESQGLRFELAKEMLAGEIGRRSAELRKLPPGDEKSARDNDLTRIVHLKNRLLPTDTRVVDAVLDRDFGEALEEEAPMLRAI